MKPVYEVCEPRAEVLEGTLIEDIFAAELTPVVDGTAPDVYGHAETFFANTYPTEGLKALLHEVFSRIAGRGGNPLVRLETNFGGGKTHGLIALYHLAQSSQTAPGDLLEPELRPAEPVRIAAVVGRDFGAEGRDHEDIHTHTLWGEIAWQLGGESAFALVADLDRQGIAPSGDTLRKVLGDEPALVMIDELGHYMRAVQGRRLAGRGTVADQVPAFLQSLASAASTQPQAAVVITLTGEQDAYAEANEQLRRALGEVQSVAARQELVLRPTQDEEVAHVVVRRLFESVDESAAEETAAVYHEYYQEAEEKQDADLPSRATRVNYRNELKHTYPFHPELLDILMKKTATIPDFQRTRGALRLLARVVRSVWERQDEDAWLIHPHHVDFADEDTRMDLTSRLGEEREGFQPVIHADIYADEEDSHAQELDRDWEARGKPPLASRLARVAFLHSLTHGRAGHAEVPDLMLACLQPGLDAELLREAVEGLQNTCWYLHHDEHSYWFSKEATLNRVLDEYTEQVTVSQGKEEARKRIRRIYGAATLRPVFFPERPADVDDDSDRIRLCVMDFDFAGLRSGDSPPSSVQRIYERTGTNEGFRQYKNALVFLLADGDQIERMTGAARTYLALQRIVNDPDVLSQLTETNQREARQRLGRAEVELRVAISRGYRHLIVPNPDAAEDDSGLQHIQLDVEKAAKIEEERSRGGGGQEKVILDALAEIGKLMRADGPAPAPDLVLDMAWPRGQQTMTTQELVRTFRRQARLPMLVDVHRLRATVRDGIEEECWVYFDGNRIWTKQSTVAVPSEAEIRLDEEHELWTVAEADARGYCLKCGKTPCECEGEPEPLSTPTKRPTDFESSRTGPQKAFTELADWAQDSNVERIEWLEVECYDRPADLQQVWTGMLYLAPQDKLTVQFEGSVELSQFQEAGESASMQRDLCQLTFDGGGGSFRRVYEFFHGLAQSASDVEYVATMRAQLPNPLAPGAGEIGDLHRRLGDGGAQQITLRAGQLGASVQAQPQVSDQPSDDQ